ncbi:MAG: alpha-1,2-fucosyltransferase, partial [Lachnospiraceae bacterium]|nr:alpha-1,2-fucosyltransferase [Lachnospiraceae bacterium]
NLPSETVFVEGNDGNNSFRDMQLMSCCKYMIYVNSSFSFLAALLNTNLHASISQNNRRL